MVLLLSGCGWFDKVKEDVNDAVDKIEDVTTPIVGQGFVLGIEEPQQPQLQPLVESGVIEPGTGVTVFLADAASADDIEESLIPGAVVVIETPDGPFTAVETEPGVYSIDPVDGGLAYGDGDVWTATLALPDDAEDDERYMIFALPPAADLDPPGQHSANTPIDLDFTGQGFHSALVVVTEVTTGDTTYTSQPDTAEELYDISSNMDPLEIVSIPAEAFPAPGTYALGVAGMLHDEDDDLEGLNTLLSRGMAGKMRIFPIIIPPTVP